MTSPGTSVSGADLDLHARVRQLERQVIALEAGAPAPPAPYGFSIHNRPRGWLFRMQVWEDAWPEALKEQDALFCRLVDALPCDASLAAVQEDRTDKLNEGLAAALARESAVLAAWSPGVEPVHGTAERALARRVVAVDGILITEDRVCTAEDVCQAVEEACGNVMVSREDIGSGFRGLSELGQRCVHELSFPVAWQEFVLAQSGMLYSSTGGGRCITEWQGTHEVDGLDSIPERSRRQVMLAVQVEPEILTFLNTKVQRLVRRCLSWRPTQQQRLTAEPATTIAI